MTSAPPFAPELLDSVSARLPFRKWLILTQYYHPEPGAPQIRLRALTRELTRRGCEVEVLTALPNYPNGKIAPEYRGSLLRKDVVDGVPVHRQWLYAATGRRPLHRLLCYLSFSLGAAARAPFLSRPDVIFVEAQPITLALSGYLASSLRNVPFIYNTPDLQVEIADEKRWLAMNSLLRAAGSLEGFLMRKAFCVSTVTEAFIDHFEKLRGVHRRNITFLPNGADTDALKPLPFDHAYAEKMGVAGKVVFTYAGTHAPYHGLEIILDVAERLRDRTDIALLMVGQGPLRATLEEQAKQRCLTNVVFQQSPFDEMSQLMSITRASIATISKMSAAPKMRLSKVVPPLACGTPVVYTGEGESAEILRRHGCGLAVSNATAEPLAAALRELADNPSICEEMGRRGRALAEEEFSWSGIVERWLEQLNLLRDGKDPWTAITRR